MVPESNCPATGDAHANYTRSLGGSVNAEVESATSRHFSWAGRANEITMETSDARQTMTSAKMRVTVDVSRA